MVELALESHSTVLIDSYHTKDAEKKTYIAKCVEDIKKVCVCVCVLSMCSQLTPPPPSPPPQSQWVVSAFRQLHRLAKGFCRSGYGQKDEVTHAHMHVVICCFFCYTSSHDCYADSADSAPFM